MKIENVCNVCDWWLMIEEDKKGNIGECYRYPPTFDDDEAEFANKRPLTLSMDLCGEFKPKTPDAQ